MRLILPLIQITAAFLALAQVPPYVGQLLLQPGVTNGTEKCLTSASDSDGAGVTIQPCNGSLSQMWTFTQGMVQVFGNKCLEVPGSENTTVHADGVKTQISSCLGQNPNQQWNYDKWTNRLVWTNMSKCLDLTGGELDDGNPIQVWTCHGGSPNQVWNTGYMFNQLPQTSQDEQFGFNNCSTESSNSSNCQTAWINSVDDFCLFAPPTNATVGDTEREAVAYCTNSARGTRFIPGTALRGVHFVTTPEYVQVTGVGDFTKINIPEGDAGGELDNRGADGKGNPIGGLVYGNSTGVGQQYHEWTTFISDKEFCFRACAGPRATQLCNHIYDIMGCYWNMPANYEPGVYEECTGDPAEPMGVYNSTTWSQGVSPTPPPHPAPSSSNCKTISVIPSSDDIVKRRAPAPTPAPSI